MKNTIVMVAVGALGLLASCDSKQAKLAKDFLASKHTVEYRHDSPTEMTVQEYGPAVLSKVNLMDCSLQTEDRGTLEFGQPVAYNQLNQNEKALVDSAAVHARTEPLPKTYDLFAGGKELTHKIGAFFQPAGQSKTPAAKLEK